MRPSGESKARRIWVCDFFGGPKAFFKGYGPIWRLGRIDCKRTECAFAVDAVLRSVSPVKGGCAFAGRDGAFSKQLFRPDVSIFVEICLRRRHASLYKPQKARALRPGRGRLPFLVRGSAAARRAGRRCFDAKIRAAAKSARVYIFSLFGAQDKTYKNLC